MNKELTISTNLKELGITPGILGYQYLREAISLTMDKPSVVHNITKVLYPHVAKQFNTTSSRVERAMRHAIEIAWVEGNLDKQLAVFGYTVRLNKGKPTNGMFIATVADYLQLTSKE